MASSPLFFTAGAPVPSLTVPWTRTISKLLSKPPVGPPPLSNEQPWLPCGHSRLETYQKIFSSLMDLNQPGRRWRHAHSWAAKANFSHKQFAQLPWPSMISRCRGHFCYQARPSACTRTRWGAQPDIAESLHIPEDSTSAQSSPRLPGRPFGPHRSLHGLSRKTVPASVSS